MMSKVVVIDSTYDTCKEAVDQVFAAFPVDVKGKKVAVKSNALRECDPDHEAVVTHYNLLKAVIEKLETLKPSRIVVGDSVGTLSYGYSERVFQVTRQKEVAGPYYRNLNKRLTVVEMEEPFRRKVALLRDILEADVYISLPKMKTHGQAMISGGVKNNYGLLAGAQKSWFHYYSVDPKKFARVIVEIFRMRPPDLVIMDGILSMEGYGPGSPETRWVNKILASDDAVALDTVEAKIVGFSVEDVPYLKIAGELGLGETNLSSIEIMGDASTIENYHRPMPPEASYSYQAGGAGRRSTLESYRDRVAYRPVISVEKCHRGCSACTDACPSGALTKGTQTPVLHSAQCMLCSACKEACDYGAIELRPDKDLLEMLVREWGK